MTRKQCAKHLGVSIANVQRAARDMGMSLAVRRYPQAVVDAVIAHYEEHGGPSTRQAFPGVSIRSIIERVPHELRHQRWSDDQLVLAARMVGFISYDAQAAIIDRPRARAASIRCLWTKRFGIVNMGHIHGLSRHEAKLFLRPGYPEIDSPFMERRASGCQPKKGGRHTVIWAEMEPWLRDDVPKFFVDIVRTMAMFQRWLYGSQDVRGTILGMQAAAEVHL